MTHNNSAQDNMNTRNPDNGTFDHEIDSALAKYTGVEPRAGLDSRILANLQAEQQRAAKHSWWRWPAVAAFAALIVIALSLAWRPGRLTLNAAAQHPPGTVRSNEYDETQIANHAASGLIPHEAVSAKKPKPHPVLHRGGVVARAPKLDQFPSPQPLSEQERMLTDYVAEHHQQAALIAQARMVALKQDLAEEMVLASATSNRQTSDQPVSQQQDR
jgi:hypothetical protein